ncbi:hypothetical protein CLOM_g14573 [Closterium sp. NIES-68]|nr:hypothetical protein CLOM_g14573 [Closterium sp. NIES-68]
MPQPETTATERAAWLALFALLLVAFAFASACHAQQLHASQAAVLSDCQKAWGRTFQGWTQGADCGNMRSSGIRCDSRGMISQLDLTGLSLTGSIPNSITSLTALTWLQLSYNQFIGRIPAGIGNLHFLRFLILGNNSLTGSISESIASLTALSSLDLSKNRLTGLIPAGIGNLSSLSFLNLEGNSLTGSIPDSITSLTALEQLYFSGNHLGGSIPANLGNMVSLVGLSLYANNLSGPIPKSIGQLSCSYIDLSGNQLDGPIPATLGSIGSLEELYLHNNSLSGPIPTAIGKLGYMSKIDFSGNRLSGSIPDTLGSMSNLVFLSFENNNLSGSVPTSIYDLRRLSHILLGSNGLGGTIPDSITSLPNLEILKLSSNKLSGTIPSTMQSLSNLKSLHMNDNRFVGSIPAGIINLPELTELDLGNNMLNGFIPEILHQLSARTYMVLSGNQLSGPIPTSMAYCSQLQRLWLDNNSLSGPLPDTFSTLSRLTSLRVGHTSLNGTLPNYIGGFTLLSLLNVNGTNLTCPADHTSCGPTQSQRSVFCQECPSFCDTCGKPAEATSNSSSSSGASTTTDTSSSSSSESSSAAASSGGGASVGVIIGIVVAAVVILLMILAGVLLCLRHKRQQRPKGMAGSLAASHCTEFSLAEVLKATNNWSEDNQLGSGAFGDVYKGVSPRDGTTVWAVKRAKLIDVDFQREIQQMADKNHPNLVRLLGFAIGGDMRTRPEQVLIYEFVPNGDLQTWIDPNKTPSPLSLQQRLDILIGAAHGLKYLHSFGVVHRDIKPANILIGDDMQAKVADFGLMRPGEGSTVGVGPTQVMGTPGYVDPMHSQTSKATTASDVYSFGVLMLVVLTGRPPLSDSLRESSHILSLASESLSSGTAASLKNPKMEAPGDAVLRVAELAISCTVERTASRPTMAHVANELQAIREEVAGKDELSAAVKVDVQIQEMKDAVAGVGSLDAELQLIGNRFST